MPSIDHAAHVGAAAAGDRPVHDHLLGREVDHRDAARARRGRCRPRGPGRGWRRRAWCASRLGYRPCAPMPVGMKPVSVNAYGSMVYTPPRIISATKNVLPSGDTRMSWGIPPTAQREVAEHRAVHDVDLHEAALELAREDRELAVDREVGVVHARAVGHVDRALELPRVRVVEVESLARLGDHDRRLAVGREVHVVRVVDHDPLPGLAGVAGRWR